MAEIFKFGSFSFFVKPSGIRGVKDIEITGGCETEDSVVDNEKFAKKKNSDKYQITLTGVIDQRLGENVQAVIVDMTEAARNAEQGYIYTPKGKLFPFPFMLTEAKAGDIDIAPDGTWLHGEVKMTMKQCAKYDGTTVTGGGGSGGNGGTQNTKYTPVAQKAADLLKDPEEKKKVQDKLASMRAELAAKHQSKITDANTEAARKRMSGPRSTTGTICTIDTKKITLNPQKNKVSTTDLRK